ncbi:MAG: hypothetical protein O3B72_07765 [Proteobacteria bacterium]|nr:hypothetical protein [Pseudomonadota bacterium]
MDSFIGQYEYHLAWTVYLLASVCFCLFWWKLTGNLKHGGWRDLLRGAALVVIFTPWYVSDAHDHLAPALVVVLMDLLIGSSDNGLAGALVLLVAVALMLALLIVRRLVFRSGSHHGD